MTIPRFFMALVILYWLAFVIGYQHIGAISSREFIFQPMSFAKLWDTLKHVWPIIFVAAFGGLAYNMRVMRGNLLDVLRQPYIEAARAKGVPGHTVVLKHAVPNALHPLVMYQGVAMPYMLSGELEVAIVLGIPTIGPLMLDSLYRNDVWVTATIFLWLSAVLVVANLLADIALGLHRPARPPGGCDMSVIRDERRPDLARHRRRTRRPIRFSADVALPPGVEPQPPQGADALHRRRRRAGAPRGALANLFPPRLAPLPPQHAWAWSAPCLSRCSYPAPSSPISSRPTVRSHATRRDLHAAAGAALLRRRRLPSRSPSPIR